MTLDNSRASSRWVADSNDASQINLFSANKRPVFQPWPASLTSSTEEEGHNEWPATLKPSPLDHRRVSWPATLDEGIAPRSLKRKHQEQQFESSLKAPRIEDNEASIVSTSISTMDQESSRSPKPSLATPTTTRDLHIPDIFLKSLKPHQIHGVKFMWRQVVERQTGCILAHAMGLGKSFQLITFLSILRNEADKKNPAIPPSLMNTRTVLILAPLITLSNWVTEFHRWVPTELQHVIGHVYNFCDESVSANTRLSKRLVFLQKWYNGGGVMLMNYDQFRTLLSPTGNQVELPQLKRYLLDPGPGIIVTDEGHRIKNDQAKITNLVKSVRTQARICLTGYPLQNNLNEYYCMLEYVSPFLLAGPEVKEEIIYQIENMYADSSPSARILATEAQFKLQLLTRHIIDRRDATILQQDMPPKTEYFIICKLTSLQYDLYTRLLTALKGDTESFLVATILMRSICNHPLIFQKMAHHRQENFKRKAQKESSDGRGTLSMDDDLDDSTSVEVIDSNEFAAVQQWSKSLSLDWSNDFFASSDDTDEPYHSSKIAVIISIAEESRKVDDKLVIVSHSIPYIDYLQDILSSLKFSVSRIDGQTDQAERQPIIDKFTNAKEHGIILLSARAGAIGVNITGANRIILCDMDWNPCHDEQSIGRIYRYGQTKPVYVYRLVTHSTIEASLLAQSVHKRGLASRVVDNRMMSLQFKDQLKRYYREPEEHPPSELDHLSFTITDAVMKEVVAKNNSIIVNLMLGEDIVYGGLGIPDSMDKDRLYRARVWAARHRQLAYQKHLDAVRE